MRISWIPNFPIFAKQGVSIALADLGYGVAAGALTAGLRTLVDQVVPGVAPFALVFPGVLLATVLRGWRAGAIALALIFYLIWRWLLAPHGFRFEHPADTATFLLNLTSGLLVIAVAHLSRAVLRREIKERSARLTRRELMFRELDHRIKNTFAMMQAVINLQRRRAGSAEAEAALGVAGERVDSIARAHLDLYPEGGALASIDLGQYLDRLCDNVNSALGRGAVIRVTSDCESLWIGRDRAVAFGLIVNELITNSAKHCGRAELHIDVSLKPLDGERWRLLVGDNGPGLPADYETRDGLGRRLVEAFAQQAGAEMRLAPGAGARFALEFEAR